MPLRIYGYGLMLVLGFLVSIAIAQWRARRLGENGEVVAHIGLLSVIGGILGARLAFVIQDWNKFDLGINVGFSQHPGDILDITSGGLIYYGGLVLAALMVVAYVAIKRLPMRRYLDIMAVSIMVGLAFGRTGCLLNGCCFGATCSDDFSEGMTFPMYSQPLVKTDGSPGPFSVNTDSPSPVYQHQLETGQLKDAGKLPDPRLTYTYTDIKGDHLMLLTPRELHGPLANDQAGVMFGSKESAKTLFDELAGSSGRLTREKWNKGLAQHGVGLLRGSEIWGEAIASGQEGSGRAAYLDFEGFWRYLQGRCERITVILGRKEPITNDKLPARMNDYLQADLYALAVKEHSLPVKPSQALGIANALIVALVLVMFFRLRSREGQVFALLLILYPITRFVEEMIRDDNPHSLLAGILTHNQYTSMVLLAMGVAIFVMLRRLPASAGPAWAERLANIKKAKAVAPVKTPRRT